MVKVEEGRVVSNKFIDFQFYTYDSPVKDLLFFLFTSVQFDVLKENLGGFLDYYYDNFKQVLDKLGCLNNELTYQNFLEEIYYYGEHEIFHIIFMLVFIVTAKPGKTKPPGENKDPSKPPPMPTKDDIPIAVKQRACWIIQEFQKRNWLGL